MKLLSFLVILPVILVLSCGSNPPPVVQIPDEPVTVVEIVAEAPPEVVQAIVEVVVEEHFDPQNVAADVYKATLEEIQALVARLNQILRESNYDAWLENLTDSYLASISVREFLDNISEELYARDVLVAQNERKDPRTVQKRIMTGPRDYFTYAVVPASRATSEHVDEIDFISEDEVKAYSVNSRGQRVLLYTLRLVDNRWKIEE